MRPPLLVLLHLQSYRNYENKLTAAAHKTNPSLSIDQLFLSLAYLFKFFYRFFTWHLPLPFRRRKRRADHSALPQFVSAEQALSALTADLR